jgi:hypothetical protein
MGDAIRRKEDNPDEIACMVNDTISKIIWFDGNARAAKDLKLEIQSAESVGDLKTAGRKARQLETTYQTMLDSSNRPDDSDSTATLRSLIAAAIDRANALEARAKAGAEQQRADMEARLARKRNVTAELLATEEAYHRRLQRMRAGYLDPLEAELRCLRPLLSREQLAGVFGNIDDVLQHSAAFLHDLRLALAPDSPHDAVAAASDGGRMRFGPPLTPQPPHSSIHARARARASVRSAAGDARDACSRCGAWACGRAGAPVCGRVRASSP